MKTSALALAFLLLAGLGPAPAQDAPPESARKRLPAATLRVQLTLSRYEGESGKKKGAMPYTLLVSVNDLPSPRTSLRMGVEVPVLAGGQGEPRYQYKSVGTNIDCNAESLDGSLYRLSLDLEESGVRLMDDKKGEPRTLSDSPLFETFRSHATLFLRDGQSTQYVMATHPVNGDVVRVDVSLSVVK